ncbi:hypothetical protein L2E82_05545 [Cichorium intybus]|uniref:Uncharacterized protein n=1 Tax=Cichorium intybus TaxID=13427 RepID=A0ACB9H7D6_CICIN|nr:hypothetical protein L2E82_05545 [Cichorium intybus]
MRIVAGCKQLFSLPNFKSVRPLHSFLNANLAETQNSIQTATESEASTSKRSCFSDACKLFDELPQWDVVSVTTLISRLTQQNRHAEAFYIFSKMLEIEITPNEYTLAALVHTSKARKNLNLGKQLHAYAIKTSFESHVFVGSAVLDLYAKLNTIEEAQKVFDETIDPNVVSYTSLVSGYIKKERFNDASVIHIQTYYYDWVKV